MPRYEVCRIERVEAKGYLIYRALLMTEAGEKIIEEVKWKPIGYWKQFFSGAASRENIDNDKKANTQVVARLMASGWEVMNANEGGWVTMMRRAIEGE